MCEVDCKLAWSTTTILHIWVLRCRKLTTKAYLGICVSRTVSSLLILSEHVVLSPSIDIFNNSLYKEFHCGNMYIWCLLESDPKPHDLATVGPIYSKHIVAIMSVQHQVLCAFKMIYCVIFTCTYRYSFWPIYRRTHRLQYQAIHR